MKAKTASAYEPTVLKGSSHIWILPQWNPPFLLQQSNPHSSRLHEFTHGLVHHLASRKLVRCQPPHFTYETATSESEMGTKFSWLLMSIFENEKIYCFLLSQPDRFSFFCWQSPVSPSRLCYPQLMHVNAWSNIGAGLTPRAAHPSSLHSCNTINAE